MKKSFKMLLGILAIGAVSASCSKDDDGGDDPAQGYQVEFKDQSTKSTSNWTLTSATAFVTEVELQDGDTSGTDADIEGTYEVDLLTGASDPALPVVETEAGTYHELDFSLGGGEINSLYVEAEWSDSVNTHPVVIELDEELEFHAESDDAEVVIVEGEVNNLVVYISVREALSSLLISQAVVSSDNTIRIGGDDNPVLTAQFIAALNVELQD